MALPSSGPYRGVGDEEPLREVAVERAGDLNGKQVRGPHGRSTWTAKAVQKAFVSEGSGPLEEMGGTGFESGPPALALARTRHRRRDQARKPGSTVENEATRMTVVRLEREPTRLASCPS
jgi:hypothetical protein